MEIASSASSAANSAEREESEDEKERKNVVEFAITVTLYSLPIFTLVL